jgi:hypothetical protein
MQQIADWLEKLGMSECGALCRKRHIRRPLAAYNVVAAID